MSESSLRATDLYDALAQLPHRQDEEGNRKYNLRTLKTVQGFMHDREPQDPENKNISLAMLTYFSFQDSKLPDPKRMHAPAGYQPYYKQIQS